MYGGGIQIIDMEFERVKLKALFLGQIAWFLHFSHHFLLPLW